MGLFSALFGSENDKQLKKLYKIADKVVEFENEYKSKTDDELKSKTQEFKDRIKGGESLDSILPEAFATCREAASRVLNMRHFYVQIVGGVVLHQGRIAEMHTGEGKTLVATLPSYLNALTGNGVLIVTVNDYLAQRDAEWMGKVHRFLGLSVGVIVSNMRPELKKIQYGCDVVYATNNELGFDYLRDNMEVIKEKLVQKQLNYAIIDEVDSILIDEARTPLIISGKGDKSSDLYVKVNVFVRSLYEEDFAIEEKEKAVNLTEIGVAKVEQYFKINNLADPDNRELAHHIRIALKAHKIMRKDSDYVVNDGEILIVDEFTGRLMIGRRYSDGLHQSIEAKENVAIRSENKTLATITFQNYFRLFKKLSGMTGTALTEEEEFKDIYGLDVVVIPTNKPNQRKDENDLIFTTIKGKLDAVVNDVIECYSRKQPILIGTITVEKSEELSKMLRRAQIQHKVLNAKHHDKEADIIAQAGGIGAVTIATNMAGRGTDIMLGGNPEYLARKELENGGFTSELITEAMSFHKSVDPEILKVKEKFTLAFDRFKVQTDAEKEQVVNNGGLRIIGTERHDSRRIDNQLRGRSGRQGDKGSSVFYISMEDDIARLFGGERMKSVANALKVEEGAPISNVIISKQIEKAQRIVEIRNFDIRKQVLKYDDVMNKQREIIYAERTKVMHEVDVHEQIVKLISPVAEEIIGYYADYDTDCENWDLEAFNRALESRMLESGTNFVDLELAQCQDVYKLKEEIIAKTKEQYEAKIAKAGDVGFDFSKLEQVIMLRTVDSKWVDHIDSMDVLRHGIGLRAYGQRDPVIAYQKEGFEMFEEMLENIQRDTVCTLMKVEVEHKVKPKLVKIETVRRISKETGRNDSCPCGSGRKFKNCCGKK